MTREGRPQDWVAAAVRAHGEAVVVAACAALLAGAEPGSVAITLDDLGGEGSDRSVAGRPTAAYWPRVWGARGLRYAWVEAGSGDGTTADGDVGREAERAVVGGLTDDHWRVRGMCAKVATQHEIGAAADTLPDLLDDDVPRVRAAAATALGAVGEHEHEEALRSAAEDEDPSVARAATRALTTLRARLDLS